MPVLHSTMLAGICDSCTLPSLSLIVTQTELGVTSLTRAFVTTLISSRLKCFSAYSEIFSEYVFRIWSRLWIMVTDMSLLRSLGYCC